MGVCDILRGRLLAGGQMGDDDVFTDDPLGVYLSAVRGVPAMDQAEEIACIEHVKARDDMSETARKRLVEANLGLVVSLAERHRHERIHILDLIEKGNEGLLHATEDLTDYLPGSFSAHATIFIERALVQAGKTELLVQSVHAPRSPRFD
jgi:RNA polymerase primary sigma factor